MYRTFTVNRNKQGGLSMAELLLVMGILAIILVMGLSSLKVSRTSADSQALALRLKSIVQSAHAEALRTGTPVALVFPTEAGAAPVARRCALLKGQNLGVVQRHFDFAGDYPSAGVFIGQWAVPSGMSFLDPESLHHSKGQRQFSNLESVLSTPSTTLDWLPADHKASAAYIFLPDGRTVSNRQRMIDGEYPLVVATGLEYRSRAGRPADLLGASDPRTVMISVDSTVLVRTGVPGGLVPPASSNPAWGDRPLPNRTPVPKQAPQITRVEPLPAPVDPIFAAAANAEAVIEAGNILTWRVEATDPDDGPLFCNVTCSSGTLSHQGEIPMLYNPESGRWVADWQWRAPRTASTGQTFDFEVTVRDEEFTATLAPGAGTATPTAVVVDPGRLLFTSLPVEDGNVLVSRFDGTDIRAIYASGGATDDGSVYFNHPAISRDSSRVAIGMHMGGGTRTVKILSADGAEYRRLPGGGGSGAYTTNLQFSADGTKLYGRHIDGSYAPVYIRYAFQADGSWIAEPSPYQADILGWSGDGNQALVQKGNDVVVIDEVGNQQLIANGAVALDWNPRGIYYGVQQGSTFRVFMNSNNARVTRFNMDIYRYNAGSSTLLVRNVRDDSAIGGDGRYLFTPEPDGIYQTDFDTGIRRKVVGGFRDPSSGTTPPALLEFFDLASSR